MKDINKDGTGKTDSRNWKIFERSKDTPSYRLQPRDTKIIEAVFRHRFLTLSHLYALLGGSKANLSNRCRLLWQDGYLERPSALRPTKILTEEIVYALGKKGAQLLEELKRKGEDFLDYLKPDTEIGELDWGETNKKQIGLPYIDHQLGVATFMVCLQSAADKKGIKLRWDGHFNRRDHIIRTPGDGVNFLPDAYFSLEVPEKGTAHHYLELDRGSVSLKRMRERYFRYFNFWKYGVNKRAFKQFRVLTITHDPDYMNSLRRIAREVGRDNSHRSTWKALLFTNVRNYSLNHATKTLEPIWFYADEETPIKLI